MTVTRDQILSAVNTLNETYEAWRASEDESLRASFNGRPTKVMSQALEEAAAALFELCDTDDIERDAWPLVRVIDRFDDAMGQFVEDCESTAARRDPSGGNEVWRPWEDVLTEIAHPKIWRQPEPMKQLVANRVAFRQIAKMYYWYDEFKEPDVLRVQREIDQPGSEYDPQTWVHPKKLEYDRELEVWWQNRLRSMEDAQQQQEVERQKKAAVESLDELILSGVNAAQILKMKPGVSEDSVRRRAEELGVALDGPLYLSQRQAQLADEERRRRAAQLQAQRQETATEDPDPESQPPLEPGKVRKLSSVLSHTETYPEMGDDLEGRIMKMAEDGRRPKDIAEALTAATGKAISPGQVGKLVKARWGEYAIRSAQ